MWWWHRIVNGVWKWTGMRAWNRKMRSLTKAPQGGAISPSCEDFERGGVVIPRDRNEK